MGYLIGLLLSLGVVALAVWLGMERERAFYPTVMMVIAAYYVLFAAMAASNRALVLEIAVGSIFVLLAAIGYKRSLWWVSAALVGHGIFDGLHHLLYENPGVPRWWPAFCLVCDVVLGAALALRLSRPA